MAGDKNISQLQALGRAFNAGDLLIIRGFLENRDFRITYAELAAAIGTGDVLDGPTLAALAGNGGTPDADNLFVTEEGLTAILAGLDLSSGAREIYTDLIITSDTAGTVSSQWVDNEGDTNTVTSEALTFIGAPSASTLRYDWVVGNDDGTVAVVNGTEGAEGAAVPPSVGGTQVGLRLVLWNDAGTAEVSPPGQSNSGDFSGTRLQTATAPNTTGKYAKVWEGNLSKDAHYAIELAYDEPKNATAPYPGTGQGNLKVSFTCNSSRNIITDTVQIETVNGTAGEWVLYQISGNKAALYHKSNHYWGRIQFRILFQNSQVRTQDFVNNGAYGTAPGSPVGTWASSLRQAPYPAAVHRQNNTVLFDKDYIHDPAEVAQSGNILFDFTGAQIGAQTWMKHDNDGAYTFPSEGETMNFEPTKLALVTGDVIFVFSCASNEASSEVVWIEVSLTAAQTAEYNA